MRTPRLRFRSIFVFLTCSISSLAAISGVRAQATGDQRWLFVPVLAAPAPRDVALSQLNTAFEVELRASGQNVSSNADAASLFETRHSSEPVKLTADELNRLQRNIGQAARHLALGELQPAAQALESVSALSGPARDYLNRDPARAHRIFDACVMTAYLYARAQQRAQALHQMFECSRAFPGLRPEGRAYPPELREVFDQARHQLDQGPATSLRVRAAQGQHCRVRLNGLEVGTTPLEVSDARPGVLRIQVECRADAAGRIHSLELPAGATDAEIDPTFDTAVHSSGALYLQYENEQERDRRVGADLRNLQKIVGANRTVALYVEGSEYPRVHVRPQFPKPHEIKSLSYSVGEGYSAEAVNAVMKELRPPPPPPAAAPNDGPVELAESGAQRTAALPAQPQEQRLVPGVVLAVLGVGAITASWIVLGSRQAVRETPLSAGSSPSPGIYDTPGYESLGLSGGGALLLSLADYFWVPDNRGVPAWAWVVGGLGVATAAVGTAFVLQNANCAPSSEIFAGCNNKIANDPYFGFLLLIDALPLLAIPFSYALRIWSRSDDVKVSLEPLPHEGAALVVRGRF
jgi:hypothetical protein